MTIKLYGHPYSHNARKVHWALEELGAPYDYETVDLMTGAQKQPDFLRMNPNGRVPVVHDGDLVLFESNAILWYVADKHGGLLPKDPAGHALTVQWLAWQASDLAARCLDPFLMKFYASMGQPLDEAKHAEAVKAAEAPLKILDQHLAGKKAMVGDAFSIADIAVAESIGIAEFGGIDLAPYANVRAWFEPLSSREAFQKTRPQG